MAYDYHADVNRLQRKRRQRARRRLGRRLRRACALISCTAAVLLVIAFAVVLKMMWIRVDVESLPFTESACALSNPNRGFYHMYAFWITEERTDYEELLETMYQEDEDTEIILVKICLWNYREGQISETGLTNIKNLFDALEALEKQMIVRFIYNEEGSGEQNEPESLDIILKHMEQLEPVLVRHSRHIFILQGLFTGKWGEMHGTQYSTADDMRRLANQLASVTDGSIFLAVRTPAQWRSIIQSDSPSGEILADSQLAARLSLFNDGLLGNRSDCGTYKMEDTDETDSLGRWNRQEELEFQKELCSYVPNGGEVINDNPYNDFEDAVKGLAERHITYLNKDYDQAVLEKWEKETVTEEGCFFGMDGYTYIDRHLGYRLLIADTDLTYDKKHRVISVEVSLKNVGFAPLYKEPQIKVVLCRKDKKGVSLEKEMICAIKSLTGGEKAEMVETAYAEIPISELSKADYEVYFLMEDLDTGRHILLANEQEEEAYGYRIGTIKLY